MQFLEILTNLKMQTQLKNFQHSIDNSFKFSKE